MEAGGRDTIQSQLKRLGCSLDWTRERFTLDPELSRACATPSSACTRRA